MTTTAASDREVAHGPAGIWSGGPEPDARARRRPRISRGITAALFVLAAVLLLRAFVMEPVVVSSTSMLPTYDRDDRVLVNKLVYRFSAPEIGDVVVLESPQGGELLIKRIVGLEGQELEIRDGVLQRDGRPVRESYVDYDRVDGFFFGPATVDAESVFVMGDQRGNSTDSRALGSIQRDRILGRVDAELPFGG